MTRRDRTLESILARGVIAVIREERPDHVPPLVDALCRAGITTIEITLTTPGAIELIASLSGRRDIIVGAGSVLTVEQAEAAFGTGARFYASPCFDAGIVAAAHRADVVALPGGLTPNEIFNAWQNGADAVKVFPMPAEGPAYIRALLGPMPRIRLAPSGGINSGNAAAFVHAGAAVLNAGSWLTPDRSNLRERADETERRGRLLLQAITEARGERTRSDDIGPAA